MSKFNQVSEYIVAIDALNFSAKHIDPNTQFTKREIDREIIKAYTGFKMASSMQQRRSARIITGNWGCGAFRGDHQLKLVIQWIAASIVESDVMYCPFGSRELKNCDNYLKEIRLSPISKVYEAVLLAGLKMVNSKTGEKTFFERLSREIVLTSEDKVEKSDRSKN